MFKNRCTGFYAFGRKWDIACDDHVAGARKALKKYLQNLNEPNQPDDARFEMLIEAPFKAPPKKRDNSRGF